MGSVAVASGYRGAQMTGLWCSVAGEDEQEKEDKDEDEQTATMEDGELRSET